MSETPSFDYSVTLPVPVMSALLHGEAAVKASHESVNRVFAASLAAVLAAYNVPVGADFAIEPQEDGTGVVRYSEPKRGPELVTDAEGAE